MLDTSIPSRSGEANADEQHQFCVRAPDDYDGEKFPFIFCREQQLAAINTAAVPLPRGSEFSFLMPELNEQRADVWVLQSQH
jgi:hypothetical protein